MLAVSIVVCHAKSVLKNIHVELELLVSRNGSKNYGGVRSVKLKSFQGYQEST